MEIREELIDAARAKELLATNTHNRNIRPALVDRLSRDMQNGNWRDGTVLRMADTPSGEMLIDGQHRLAAVIKTDTMITAYIIHGLTIEDQNVIDTGAKRTLADALKLRGEKNPSALSAAIGWLWYRTHGGGRWANGRNTPTINEGLAVLEANPGLRDSLSPTRRAWTAVGIPHGLAACLHYEMTQIDEASASEFWNAVGYGANLAPGSPILRLRNRMEQNRGSAAKLDGTTIAALIIKCWNFYVDGVEYIDNLRWRRGGAGAEKMPELHSPES